MLATAPGNIAYGHVDASAAYVLCLDDTGGTCLVAQRRADGTVALTVRETANGTAAATYQRPADALAVDAGAGTVRLRTAVPGVGSIDVTSTAEAARTTAIVTDGCALLPLYTELTARGPDLAHAAATTGTVGGVPVRPLHRCTTVLALGPAGGLWRMAGGL